MLARQANAIRTSVFGDQTPVPNINAVLTKETLSQYKSFGLGPKDAPITRLQCIKDRFPLQTTLFRWDPQFRSLSRMVPRFQVKPPSSEFGSADVRAE
ncbi:hypothetical protein J6590_010238 [Homalodisca vitripennis]|nr:hypothetical protein J6590_010238 [Homalodisca vitripennis]